MTYYFIDEPPAPILPGQRFRVNRRGTVNHIARTTARREKLSTGAGPGLFVMAVCGEAGVLPDRLVDDHTIRPADPKKRGCGHCITRGGSDV